METVGILRRLLDRLATKEDPLPPWPNDGFAQLRTERKALLEELDVLSTRIAADKASPGSEGETLTELEAKFSADTARADELLQAMLDLRSASVEDQYQYAFTNNQWTEIYCYFCTWTGQLEAWDTTTLWSEMHENAFMVFAEHFLDEHEKASYRTEV